MTVNLPLKLTIQTNPEDKEHDCAICGWRFTTPICGVLSGVPGGDHAVCGRCILKSQIEMLAGATEFKDYMAARVFAHGQLCQYLKHCQIKNKPTMEQIDQFTFESQVGELENE